MHIDRPLSHWTDKADPRAHGALASAYSTALADPAPGKTRKEVSRLTGWGATLIRDKERAGILTKWPDGSITRIGTTSVWEHVLDLIAEGNPIGAPPKQARTPKTHFPRGYHRSRKPHSPAELAALARANARRAEEAKARRETRNSSSEAGAP
jgi:hypothetical protein